MELYGKIVKLKAVEQEDIEMLRLLTNSPDYEKMIVGWSFPVSKKEQDAWFQTLKNTVDGIIRYTIHTEEDGPVGLIGLTAFD